MALRNIRGKAHAQAQSRKEGMTQVLAPNPLGFFFAPLRLCVSSFFHQTICAAKEEGDHLARGLSAEKVFTLYMLCQQSTPAEIAWNPSLSMRTVRRFVETLKKQLC